MADETYKNEKEVVTSYVQTSLDVSMNLDVDTSCPNLSSLAAKSHNKSHRKVLFYTPHVEVDVNMHGSQNMQSR